MTRPAQANQHRDGDPRFYTHPTKGVVYPSVTTVLNVVSKPALVPWATKLTAEYAVENRDRWTDLPAGDAVALIKDQHKRSRDKAADVGSAAHAAADLFARTGEAPDAAEVIANTKFEDGREVEPEAIIPHIEQYAGFLAAWHPRFLYTEATVYNHTYGYAGSLDMLVELAGLGRRVVDIKTGKGVYAEAALQQAAYAFAEEIVTPDGDGWLVEPMPVVDGTAVLHLRPDGWKLIPLTFSEELFERFVCATGLSEWQRDEAKTMVGKPAPAPVLAPADPAAVRRLAVLCRQAGMDDDERHAFVHEAVGRAGLTDCTEAELAEVERALRALRLPLVGST